MYANQCYAGQRLEIVWWIPASISRSSTLDLDFSNEIGGNATQLYLLLSLLPSAAPLRLPIASSQADPRKVGIG